MKKSLKTFEHSCFQRINDIANMITSNINRLSIIDELKYNREEEIRNERE